MQAFDRWARISYLAANPALHPSNGTTSSVVEYDAGLQWRVVMACGKWHVMVVYFRPILCTILPGPILSQMRRAKFSFNSGNRVHGVMAMKSLSCAYGLWAVLQKVPRNSGFIYWHCENWKKFCTLNLGSRGCILRDRRNTFRHVSLFSLRFLVAGAALVTCRRCWFDESLAGLRARVAVSRVSEAVAG